MTHLHVCLVSDQPIPNLTTVLQLKPDEVILLKTKEMSEKANFLYDVIKKQGFNVHSELIEAYNIDNVINVSEGIIKQCTHSKVTLNITGGTKIGTLGTFQAFYNAGKDIYYVDTKNNKILNVSGASKESEDIRITISIDDYLAAYGFKVESYVDNDKYIFERKDITNKLAAIVSSKEWIISDINSKLHNFEENSLPVEFNVPKAEQLMEYFLKLPGVIKVNNKKVKILNYETLRYLKGGWFEEYVYMIAKSLNPDEIKLNVIGRWMTEGKHKPKNEFDIILSKVNRLFYISCKTANSDRKDSDNVEGVGRQYLYELDSLADRALGLFGKRMLVSAKSIEDPAVRKRSALLNIKLIDGRNINTLRENLKQWLMM